MFMSYQAKLFDYDFYFFRIGSCGTVIEISYLNKLNLSDVKVLLDWFGQECELKS